MQFDAPDPQLLQLVSTLNPAQKEAVTAPPDHRLVLAGAGSGKTRVLTHRIAWLVAVENISPHSILAVTFTNKAAAEMRGRIEQLINVPVRAMWVGTFHGIAHRMLRLHWSQARLPQNFQILDADDQQRLVKRVLRNLELPEDKWPPKQVTAFINAQKDEGVRPQALQDQGDFAQRQLVRVYTAYQQQCETNGLVDFAELLLRAFELCRDNAEIQAHYRNRFRHILVDEFQDTNTLQYQWLRVLAGERGILFAVGDDDQCLAAGTEVTMADGSVKPIERIAAGDLVLSGYGSGDFRPARVSERLAVGRRKGMVELRTRGGRSLLSTPEHTHFAGYLDGPAHPHHRPQSRNSRRRNVVVTLCGDRRGASPMHRISIVGNDEAGRAALLTAGCAVRKAKAGSSSWRFETCRKDFGELMEIAERARKVLDGSFAFSARLGRGRSLPFVKAAAIRPGMVVVAADGSFDAITEVVHHDTSVAVYDLNIERTHNFVAGGVVTHNSIYSWRGAKVENMMRLSRDFPSVEVVRLEQNYRSTGTILKAANGLIAKNLGRLGKNLWTELGEGEPIQLYAAFNEYDEAEFVVGRMKSHLEGRCRHTDLAVLYRSNAQSRVLEEALIRNRIPYRIYGGLRFFERMEVKDALAYLRLVASRDDDASFERAVNTPARGIGAATLERLRQLAREQGLSLWKAAQAAGTALGRSLGNLKGFLDLIERLAADAQGQPLSQATELAIARSGLREHYQKEKGEQAESRLENLEELVNAARSFERPADDEALDPLNSFLAHAALEAGEQQAGAGEDCVQLMTLHSAKGLEFPIVFLVGMENGLFPHQRAVEDGSLEEERRLCYVGITRARRQLYLSYAEVRRIHGVEQIGAPSMFLKDIPAECVVETRPRAGLLRPAFSAAQRPYGSGGGYGGSGSGGYGNGSYGSRPAAPRYGGGESRAAAATSDTGPGGYKLGARVRHAKFGEGTILSFDGDGDRTRVEVRFRDAGTKWLMLAQAHLQQV